MTVSASPQKNGAASAATDPRHGSNPVKDIKNMKEDNTAAVKAASVHHDRAVSAIIEAGELIHAAWMAAGSLNREDHAAEQDALRAVLHRAGETLDDATEAVQLAQLGRAS